MIKVANLTDKQCCSKNSSSSSSLTIHMDICRICHCEADANNPLLSPCYCSGSLKYVHQHCLQQWLQASDTKVCELCKFNYILQTKFKPLNEWRGLEMSNVESRRLLCAILFHCIAALCVFWSLFVLIDRATEEVHRGLIAWPFWTKIIVVAVGFTGGVIFMYIQCKQYVQLCTRWQAHNRVVLIQNAPMNNDGETQQQQQQQQQQQSQPTHNQLQQPQQQETQVSLDLTIRKLFRGDAETNNNNNNNLMKKKTAPLVENPQVQPQQPETQLSAIDLAVRKIFIGDVNLTKKKNALHIENQQQVQQSCDDNRKDVVADENADNIQMEAKQKTDTSPTVAKKYCFNDDKPILVSKLRKYCSIGRIASLDRNNQRFISLPNLH